MRNYLRFKFLPIYIWYLGYVFKHKWCVGVECFKRGLYWQGIVHGIQKFHPIEFFPYALNYHGPYDRTNRPSWLCDDYERAWKHHYACNLGKHHWLHWVNPQDGTATDMPEKYRLEMVADFAGTGLSLHGFDESKQWYAKNRHKMTLHPNTRQWLDNALKA